MPPSERERSASGVDARPLARITSPKPGISRSKMERVASGVTSRRAIPVPPVVKMAETVRPFRESRPAPEPEQEGALCVVSADGKGIPIRRATPEAPIQGHDPEQEAKTNRKKMAVVGTVYTIDPCVRMPEEVVASLFRSPDDDPLPSERPVPKHKRLWASLPQEQDGEEVSATEATLNWLAQEVARRHPEAGKPIVLLMDGQKSLWEAGQRVLSQVSTIGFSPSCMPPHASGMRHICSMAAMRSRP